MKKIILLFILISISIFAQENDPILYLFKQISEMKLSSEPNYPIYDPFSNASLQKKEKRINPTSYTPIILPILGAIIDNSAFLDGKWIKEGETIKGFKVISIKSNGVILKRKNKKYFLSFHPSKQLLKIINKDFKKSNR